MTMNSPGVRAAFAGFVVATAGALIAILSFGRPGAPVRAQRKPICNRDLAGTWYTLSGDFVEIAPNGEWRFVTERATLRGLLSFSGDEVHISDRALEGKGSLCPKEQQGIYRLSWDLGTCAVYLRAVEDPCAMRRRVLQSARLSRWVNASSRATRENP